MELVLFLVRDSDIARIIRGEPGAWPRFLTTVAVVLLLAFGSYWVKQWWIEKRPPS